MPRTRKSNGVSARDGSPRPSRLLAFLEAHVPFFPRKRPAPRRRVSIIVGKRHLSHHRPHRHAAHAAKPTRAERLLQQASSSLKPAPSLRAAPPPLAVEKKVKRETATPPPAIPDDERIFLPATAPVAAKTTDTSWREGSIGGNLLGKEEPVSASARKPAGHAGFGSVLSRYFSTLFSDHRPASPSRPEQPVPAKTVPAIADVPAAARTEKPDARRKELPTINLDNLLRQSDAKTQASPSRPEPVLRKEVARPDLMESPSLPAPEPQPSASARKAMAKAAKENEAAQAKEAPKEKEKEKEPAPSKPAEAPAEIVYRHKAVVTHSGFSDFLDSLKHIGMGRYRITVVQNLATMLEAGLPLVDSLRTLQLEMRGHAIHALIQRIIDRVENGSALWRAMEEERFFSPHAIALIRIGEEAGNLAENMGHLAVQQEKDQALRGKITMAMIYPSIVLFITIAIVVGLGMFVLPNLINVLYSLHVPLPLVTRIVIAFTNFFVSYGKIAVPGLVAFVILLVILAKFTRFKIVIQWITLHIPGIGRLTREATIGRFGVIMGGLLQAGVPVVDALRSLAEVTPLVNYQRFYYRLLDHVMVGDSFTKSFESIRGSEKLLPISVQQLVMTGEKSGSLSKLLLKIADMYEKKANDTAQKLPVILEPMLLLFMGGLVGTIALSIIVPIYSIVGNISH